MSSYKLTYFDIDGGRAEPVRIAFHAAGIPFEDVRLSFPEFGKMRSTTRFNSLPVLEIDGVVVTQTNAMCRYVGKMAGLYPSDDREALYCDEVLEAAEDLSHRIVVTFGLEGEALKAARAKLVDGWLSIFVRGFNELLTRGGGRYFADNRLTMADLKVSGAIRWLQSGTLDHVPTDLVQNLAPALADHAKRVAEEPVVVAYYASRA
jgi:glutathione S-transferase